MPWQVMFSGAVLAIYAIAYLASMTVGRHHWHRALILLGFVILLGVVHDWAQFSGFMLPAVLGILFGWNRYHMLPAGEKSEINLRMKD